MKKLWKLNCRITVYSKCLCLHMHMAQDCVIFKVTEIFVGIPIGPTIWITIVCFMCYILDISILKPESHNKSQLQFGSMNCSGQ